jgi:nitroreductase
VAARGDPSLHSAPGDEEDEVEFDVLVRQRRSIRGYRPDPVPKELIREIVEVASYAPSSMNTQPWHFHVLTGEPLDRIRRGNTELMMAGARPQREIPVQGAYAGVHRERQVEIAFQLFDAMGIRDDKAMRTDWMMRGFRQFDAPVSIVVTYDKDLELATIGHFDLGAVTYGLCLAAWDRGLGTVINGQGIMQSAVVREHANIPEGEVIMTCVAMGFPAEGFAANDVRARRVPAGDIVTFVGFD